MVDAVVILRAPILREKQHAAAEKAPVARKHQRGKLCAKAHRAHGRFAQRRDHHGVDHAAGRRQHVLQSHRDRNDRKVFQKLFPRKACLRFIVFSPQNSKFGREPLSAACESVYRISRQTSILIPPNFPAFYNNPDMFSTVLKHAHKAKIDPLIPIKQ